MCFHVGGVYNVATPDTVGAAYFACVLGALNAPRRELLEEEWTMAVSLVMHSSMFRVDER